MARANTHTPKTDKVEYERRLLTVQTWIIEGVPASVMIQSILGNDWCTSKRHAERMLSQARTRWIEHEEEKLSAKRKMKVQRLQHIARKIDGKLLSTPGGIRAVLAVEKEIILLEGLRPSKQMIEAEVAKDQGKQADPLAPSSNTLIIEALMPYGQAQALNTTD